MDVDLHVVGAGALGLSAALALVEAGHDVTVHEQAQPGAGATGKAAGIVSTMTWNDDDARLIQETRGRIGELLSLAAGELSHARAAWRPYDSITIAGGDKLAHLDDMQSRLERIGEEPERLAYREATAEFSSLEFAPGEEVLVAQEDGAIDAAALVEILLWNLDSEGVEVRAGSSGPAPGEGDGTVLAAGAWTRRLLEARGARLPLQAFRVQLASLAWPEAEEVPIVHDGVQGFYTRPESESSMMAGNGTILEDHDPTNYNEAGDAAFVEAMADKVVRRFKGGAQAKVRSSWAGLVVGTPDRRPMCGAVPGHDDLWVLTGDNGYGVMRCLALGERLAEAVEGRRDDALDPGRFGDEWDSAFPLREGFGF